MSVDRGAFGAGDGLRQNARRQDFIEVHPLPGETLREAVTRTAHSYQDQMRRQYAVMGLDPANLSRSQWTAEEAAAIEAAQPIDMIEIDGVWMTRADAAAAKN